MSFLSHSQRNALAHAADGQITRDDRNTWHRYRTDLGRGVHAATVDSLLNLGLVQLGEWVGTVRQVTATERGRAALRGEWAPVTLTPTRRLALEHVRGGTVTWQSPVRNGYNYRVDGSIIVRMQAAFLWARREGLLDVVAKTLADGPGPNEVRLTAAGRQALGLPPEEPHA